MGPVAAVPAAEVPCGPGLESGGRAMRWTGVWGTAGAGRRWVLGRSIGIEIGTGICGLGLTPSESGIVAGRWRRCTSTRRDLRWTGCRWGSLPTLGCRWCWRSRSRWSTPAACTARCGLGGGICGCGAPSCSSPTPRGRLACAWPLARRRRVPLDQRVSFGDWTLLGFGRRT